MKEMFFGATSFNNGGDMCIGDLDVSNVENFEKMFFGADNFDQQINSWTVKETANLTNKQLNTSELAIKRVIKKDGSLFTRVFPHLPVTSKPAEVRMGKGKGSVSHHIARISPGSFIFELKNTNRFLAKAALRVAASKLPFKTLII